MNYRELKDLISAYSHRDDLEDNNLLDTLIDVAALRIGNDTRLMESERIATLTVTDFVGLPNDFSHMRLVTTTKNGRPVALLSISPAKFEQLCNAGGQDLQYYTIKNGQIFINGEAAITINYYVTPAKMRNDTDANLVLSRYPNLYLYAALVEVHMYSMDSDALAIAEQRYQQEVTTHNAQADKQRHGPTSATMRVDT